MSTMRIPCFFFLSIFSACLMATQPPERPPVAILQQLDSADAQTRAKAEKRLFGLGDEAVGALVGISVGDPSPSGHVVDATLRILEQWEEDSWTEPASEAAIDRFVELVRDPENYAGKHPPLSPDSPIRFAEKVRVLDVSPREAAAHLRRKKGIKIAESLGGSGFDETFYHSIHLTRDWVPNPQDWLYIANLAQEIDGTPYTNGKRHPISISVTAKIAPETLVECFKYFRKSKNSPFDLFILHAPIGSESLHVLANYPEMTGILANEGLDDIDDEVWAECISSWPNAVDLTLLPCAGNASVAAAHDLEYLTNITFRNTGLTETDLQLLRGHKSLQSLWVVEGGQLVKYLDQQDTGIWQREAGAKNREKRDGAQ